jgi:adenosylhomocysteine nucleosidase
MTRRLFSFCLLTVACAPAAERYDLLVQGALDSELQPILTALTNKKEVKLEAWTFWTGRIGPHRVVVSRTEVGPINAVASTVLGIQRFHPKAIINQGTAGAHNPSLQLWDIVVSEKTTDYGAFRSSHGNEGEGVSTARWTPIAHRLREGAERKPYPNFPADPTLIEAALEIKNPRARVLRGNVGSAYQFNKEIDYLRWVHRTYKTDTEDMESAFVAGVATAMRIPFVAIRIVSDSEYNHPTFEQIAGQYCAEFVVDMIRALPKR